MLQNYYMVDKDDYDHHAYVSPAGPCFACIIVAKIDEVGGGNLKTAMNKNADRQFKKLWPPNWMSGEKAAVKEKGMVRANVAAGFDSTEYSS